VWDLTNGTLWCWGYNASGEVGNGSTTNQVSPVQIGGDTWKSVEAGTYHTCGIRSDDSLWCWGYNASGQVGDGTGLDRWSPVSVAAGAWTVVVGGGAHTCGIRDDAKLWCWGSNGSGQVGDGAFGNQFGPVPVGTANWRALSLGAYHSCGIRSDDSLWCWGNNSNGQIGDGTGIGRTTPVPIGTGAWKTVDLGGNHTCGIRTDDMLWCWGYNAVGQVGDATTTGRTSPVAIGSTRWRTVGAGDAHSCAITVDNTRACWGSNADGRLGEGTEYAKLTPYVVGGALANWETVAGGNLHTCGIAQGTNALWCWGGNSKGQVGDGTLFDLDSPAAVGTSPGSRSAGAANTPVGSRPMATCGAGGQLLRTTRRDEHKTMSPVQIGAATWKAVDAGAYYTCGIRSDDTLWCWGENLSGQGGNGSTAYYDVNSPVQAGTSTWTSISAGGSHTCGLQTDGTLWCWGNNVGGQLGDGSGVNQYSPVHIGIATWKSISTGHTCGLPHGWDPVVLGYNGGTGR
jgi:alpha-tubulin suppressor-like RCC1 family protein